MLKLTVLLHARVPSRHRFQSFQTKPIRASRGVANCWAFLQQTAASGIQLVSLTEPQARPYLVLRFELFAGF